MPGKHEIAAELGVNHKTVEAALGMLEAEGLLVSQGPGRRRRIVGIEGREASAMRVEILAFDDASKIDHYMVDLQHRLKESGHRVGYASKTLQELGMSVRRVARLVAQTPADAWIVCSGSREILEWFAAQPVPAFALLGRRRGLAIAAAGPDKIQALRSAVRHLMASGHRRIVMLVRDELRIPRPATVVQTAFLDELSAHGIAPAAYHLPDWQESPEGFREVLESLFRLTPPTALMLDESWTVLPTLQFCLARGIQIPRDMSLVCGDPDPSFDWCLPPVSHIRWDPAAMVRRVVRWVDGVARGKPGFRQTLTHAEFVPGGTIGPARE